MTRLPPRAVHAVPLLDPGEHRPSSWCPCKPEAHRDLNEPIRTVYVHRRVPQAGVRRNHDGDGPSSDPATPGGQRQDGEPLRRAGGLPETGTSFWPGDRRRQYQANQFLKETYA